MRILIFLLLIPQMLFANSLFNYLNHSNFDTLYEEPIEGTNFFPLHRTPEKENIFIFSPKEHLWAVYNKKGERVGIGKAIGGKDYCPDIQEECRTVTGKFKVFRREGKNCASNTFPINKGGAPMPYCMFFHEGYAIHGANNVPPHNKSHGCIRITLEAAKWMNKNYMHEGSYVLVLPYS